MTNVKRLIILVTAFILLFSLSGCNNQNDEREETESKQESVPINELEIVDTDSHDRDEIESTISEIGIEIEPFSGTKEIALKRADYSYDMDTSLLANPMDLKYASNDLLVLRGEMGLFVYDMKKTRLVNAIDLSYIDSNAMQGSYASGVSVSKDGSLVYMHKFEDKKDMYIYDIYSDTLTRTDYSEPQDLFDGLVDTYDVLEGLSTGNDSFNSINAVKMYDNHYGYLNFYKWELSGVSFVIDDMIYSIFGNGKDNNHVPIEVTNSFIDSLAKGEYEHANQLTSEKSQYFSSTIKLKKFSKQVGLADMTFFNSSEVMKSDELSALYLDKELLNLELDQHNKLDKKNVALVNVSLNKDNTINANSEYIEYFTLLLVKGEKNSDPWHIYDIR